MSPRRRFVLALMPLLLAALPIARSETLFDTAAVSPSLWPWPAAVAVEDWGDAWRGVVWVDGSTVTYSRTQGFSLPVYHESVAYAADVTHMDAVADATAEIHACFDGSVGGVSGLRYAHRSYSGTWSTEWIATGAGEGLFCSIGLRSDLEPVVVYANGSGTRHLSYAWRTGGGWLVYPLDTFYLITAASIATDWHDTVHIAWARGSEVRYCQGPGQPVETVATGVTPTAVRVAHGHDGLPRVAILDSRSLKYAVRSVSGWSVEPVLPARADVRDLAFAIGINGVPCLVYTTENPDDPLLCALLVKGEWREQAITDQPLYGLVQRPSLRAAQGLWANLDLVVAWIGDGLNASANIPGYDAYSTTRLRACPDGDLVSSVEVYDARGVPRELCPVVLDFTAPGVMDTVNFCFTWRDTLRRLTDATGAATFRLATGGAVGGGVGLSAPLYGPETPLIMERSAPVAGTDLDGNGSVTPVDRALFDQILGTDDPRGDLDFDGDVDGDDRQVLLDHLWHACTTSDAGAPDATAGQGARITAVSPNPAGGAASIAWHLPVATRVRVTVHDVAGRRVRALTAVDAPAGPGETAWDGCDDAGRPAPGGVYFARLEAGGEVALRRLVRLR